ncbi:hypothetical protein FHR32_004398 [Streptosporangium album]|uniref:Protein kinase domain-containing protein n=1 Tax=Streptosporangium album TaxID=47479 RepID=A0A7W7WAM8_9ACTN|nr:hypothetical protein [Streptosporangium album]MBB4940093.1 hypothetical protein [Streptosporangium album]
MTDPNLLAGRYRLLERRDRMGTTWRSRDELLNRDVTIAEVRLPPPSPHRDWLLGQIRAASGLRHPGIATLHDVISAPDRVWLVLESVEGRSLVQTVRSDGPLSAGRAAEVGLRVLDALAAAHGRGVHLAATPETVLLASDGRVVLTGIVAPAPTGDLRDLGATLFTAVEGRSPDTGSQTVPHMPDGTPLAALAPGSGTAAPPVEGPLAPLLEGLLADDPAHRPDATSVRLSLERLAPRPAAFPRRPLVVAVAAVAAVAVAAGAAFWFWPRPSGPARAAAPIPTFFAKAPDPCALISKEQAAELWLDSGPSKEQADRCSWRSQDTGQPQSMRYVLWVEALRSSSGEKAHAAYLRFFRQEGERTKTSAGLPLTLVQPPKALPGVAAEAYTVEATNKLTYYTGVVMRAGNLVVVVQYQRNGESDPHGETREGALRTGRWVLETLSRTD